MKENAPCYDPFLFFFLKRPLTATVEKIFALPACNERTRHHMISQRVLGNERLMMKTKGDSLAGINDWPSFNET
jgi:hypothetical protein